MKSLSRHKTFIKDLRNVQLTDTQATKLFLYVAKLLNNEAFKSKDMLLSRLARGFSGVVKRIDDLLMVTWVISNRDKNHKTVAYHTATMVFATIS